MDRYYDAWRFGAVGYRFSLIYKTDPENYYLILVRDKHIEPDKAYFILEKKLIDIYNNIKKYGNDWYMYSKNDIPFN